MPTAVDVTKARFTAKPAETRLRIGVRRSPPIPADQTCCGGSPARRLLPAASPSARGSYRTPPTDSNCVVKSTGDGLLPDHRCAMVQHPVARGAPYPRPPNSSLVTTSRGTEGRARRRGHLADRQAQQSCLVFHQVRLRRTRRTGTLLGREAAPTLRDTLQTNGLCVKVQLAAGSTQILTRGFAAWSKCGAKVGQRNSRADGGGARGRAVSHPLGLASRKARQ